jgi:hypothetical protein
MITAMYLDRILDPVADCLTPEVARTLVELKPEPHLQERIDLLADKCTEVHLSQLEKTEYETYIRGSKIVSFLQAKARGKLEQH